MDSRSTPLLAIALFSVLTFSGCTTVPSTYLMTPAEVHELRSGLGTIGLVRSEYSARIEFTTPAKGWSGGLKRGFIYGASVPVLIGFVSPIPGGTLAGAVVAPFTAIYGAVTGASKAPAVEEIEKAEAGIDEALERLTSQQSGYGALETFEQLAEELTGREFVVLPGRGPGQMTEEVEYSELHLPGIDTVLEIRVDKGGLWGLYEIDPPSVAFLESRIRLIRVADNEVLLEDTVVCVGEQRKYTEWGEESGRLFYADILACIPRLRNKIIDDLFLVYPPETT